MKRTKAEMRRAEAKEHLAAAVRALRCAIAEVRAAEHAGPRGWQDAGDVREIETQADDVAIAAAQIRDLCTPGICAFGNTLPTAEKVRRALGLTPIAPKEARRLAALVRDGDSQ